MHVIGRNRNLITTTWCKTQSGNEIVRRDMQKIPEMRFNVHVICFYYRLSCIPASDWYIQSEKTLLLVVAMDVQIRNSVRGQLNGHSVDVILFHVLPVLGSKVNVLC